MPIEPIYHRENTQAAYQLNWSLSVFGQDTLPSPQSCINELRDSAARDQVRILEFRHYPPNVAQFLISSTPRIAPAQIVRSVKGRWQHLCRAIQPIAFRRNYRITSVGSSNADVLDQYVRKQPIRHRMADPRVQAMFEEIQFHDDRVDLTEIKRSSHGEYLYALHIVIESADDWHEIRPKVLAGYCSMLIKSCSKHAWRLYRIGLLANHLHIMVGPSVNDSPDDVALVFMNNMAYSQQMKPVLRFSYYTGSFGEYDRGAIWNNLDEPTRLGGAKPTETQISNEHR